MRSFIAFACSIALIGCGQSVTPDSGTSTDSGVCDDAEVITFHCGPTALCNAPFEFCSGVGADAVCLPVTCECTHTGDPCGCIVATQPACSDGGAPVCTHLGNQVNLHCP